MSDIRVPNSEQCLHVLRHTPGILRSLLSLATREQLDWQPSAQRWSITMVLAHLTQVETKGFRERFDAMLGQDGPVLPGYDSYGTNVLAVVAESHVPGVEPSSNSWLRSAKAKRR